jgi:hypothetical protein
MTVMAKDPSTTVRDVAFGADRPSLTDWLVRDLRIASSTDRPAPRTTPHDDEEVRASVVAAAPAEAEAESFEPQIADVELERYEPIQVEAIDGAVDVPIGPSAAGTGALLAGAAVASVSHEVLIPPPDTGVAEAAQSLDAPEAPEAAAATEAAAPADTTSSAAMSPPEDWLEEDEMGAAGAFFSSSADFDEFDEAAPIVDETVGSSLSPQVLTAEEDEGETAAPLLVAGVAAGTSRWKTIAAIAAAVLVVVLFGQRLAKRHAQAAAPPLPVATISPQAPAAESPREESPAEAESMPASADAKEGKGSSGLGGGRAHAGPADSPDPATPGGPSVARFPDLPREILDQLEQVFESESGQRNKAATDSMERYSR